ncbi:Sphingomyelin phosphodiesterase [Entamoeba marina]
MASDELPLKIILIGDLGVGKTTLMHKYAEYTGETREIIHKSTTFEKRKVKIIFQDTCGAEQMATVTSAVYHNAVACVFVYDVGNADSLTSLPNWVGELKRFGHNKGDIPKFLCGNKCENECVVTDEELREFLNRNPMPDFKVSAETGEGLNAMFDKILPLAIEESIKQLKEKKKPIPGGEGKPKKKSCHIL